MVKTILIISFSNLAKDPRVNRQIRFLSKRYHVIAAGTGDPNVEGVEYVHCDMPNSFSEKAQSAVLLLRKRYEKYYWTLKNVASLYKKLSHIQPDLIIANDIESLPLALRLADGAKVILDAHEYAPRNFEDIWLWRIFFQGLKEYMCKTYIPRVNGMMTVCQSIAEEYEKNFGVKSIVVTNAPSYSEINPHPTSSKKIRIIYHGNANPSRKIENMIYMMDYLDNRFELDLLLVMPLSVGNKRYMDKLGNMVQSRSRVRILPPVPMQELVEFSSQYDIGLFLVEPTTFNLRYTLPNKFFEFIQSRLAIAIGPSPEMARIVKEHDCGIVADDFLPQTLASHLIQLDEKKIDYYKNQSHKIAKMMSSEQNEGKILRLVDKVLNG